MAVLGSSVHLPAFVTSLGLAVVFVAAWSARQRQQSSVTGGYFHKLLPFLQPSCVALASLIPVNGACVAGCGPREAATFTGGWGGGLRGAGGAAWSRSAPESGSPRTEGWLGWPHPGHQVPALEVLLASTLSELSFFSFYS